MLLLVLLCCLRCLLLLYITCNCDAEMGSLTRSAWSNCWPAGQFWPANNYGDLRDYDRVAMRPENPGHVRKSGVLSGDNMTVRKFAQM